MRALAMANEALRVLKENKVEYDWNPYCTVQSIAAKFKDYDGKELPLNPAKHQMLRAVLERLYHAGAVERKAGSVSGKFQYRIRIDKWDHRDPFKLQTNFEQTPQSHVEVHDHSNDVLDRQRKKIEELEEMVRTIMGNAVTKIKEAEDKLTKAEDDLKDSQANVEALKAEKNSTVRVIHVKRYDAKQFKLKDKVLPKVFDRVKDLAENRRNVLLVGPAGCGKTYLAKLVADVLGLDFASLSCTAGMSEAHLLGRAVPDLTHGKNRFQGTDFLRVYEQGGVGLLDELDAADPNLLLAVNTGLANGYMNVPNRQDDPRAWRHKDFVCIGTANTFGRGATRMYSGRNQLDEATLDRFRIGIVECGYDEVVEKAICPDDDLRTECQRIRTKIEAAGLRRIMSTRFMEDAWVMMSNAKWTKEVILEVFFEGWSPEEKAKVR
jgi:cobaltochelatase CobS